MYVNFLMGEEVTPIKWTASFIFGIGWTVINNYTIAESME